MARLNKTKYALLGVLNLQPGSGYDIKKFCDFSISHFWNENYGHIYPVLKQLEEEGLATKTTELSEGKPVRHVFHITDRGREELNRWLNLPTEGEPLRSEFLLKLFFARDLPIPKIITMLQEQKEKHLKRIKKYQAIEAELQKGDLRKHRGYPLWILTIKNGLHYSQAMVAWCDEAITMLQEQGTGPVM